MQTFIGIFWIKKSTQVQRSGFLSLENPDSLKVEDSLETKNLEIEEASVSHDIKTGHCEPHTEDCKLSNKLQVR